MDINEIRDLIKFVSRSGVNEVEIEQKDFKITIRSDGSTKKKKKGEAEKEDGQQQQMMPMQMFPMPMPQQAPMPQQQQMPPQQPQPQQPPEQQAPQAEEKTGKEAPDKDKGAEETDSAHLVSIKTPMIGTFYRSPSPEKPPYVNVGDTVKEGDIVCVIEAMKLFNEIESEVSGKIVKVLVDDSSPVEYDQPLFLVEPS